MKMYRFFFIFPLLISASLIAKGLPRMSYERVLKNFSIEESSGKKEIYFLTDNDWLFIAEIPLLGESKLYSIDKLIGTHMRIHTDAQSPALEITLENPNKPTCDKISFSAAITKMTYDSLPTIVEMQINNYLLFSTGYVFLSDGSVWYIKHRSGIDFARTYWSLGDHVIISKNYNTKDIYTLVNMDVSGDQYIDYYKDKNEQWFSKRDPRSLDAILYGFK